MLRQDAAAAAGKDEADDGMIENEMQELSSHNASIDIQDFRGFVPQASNQRASAVSNLATCLAPRQAFSLLSDDGFDLRSETFSM